MQLNYETKKQFSKMSKWMSLIIFMLSERSWMIKKVCIILYDILYKILENGK